MKLELNACINVHNKYCGVTGLLFSKFGLSGSSILLGFLFDGDTLDNNFLDVLFVIEPQTLTNSAPPTRVK